MLNEKQIQDNWEKFMSIIDELGTSNKASDNRWDKLYTFYDKYADKVALTPASSKLVFHSAFPGGYIDHILRVLQSTVDMMKLWKKNGAEIDFTQEELIMSVLSHDLGKIGNLQEDKEYYVDNDSQWHIEKRGEIYKFNDKLGFMKIQDRSLYILQQLGVELTENEYLAIKTHNGIYDESNKQYFSFSNGMKITLPYILHLGDFTAVFIENQQQTKK